MKWSKEREKAFEKVINHIIEVIEDKSKSEDLPEWVVDQVQKRLNKINYYYAEAKKSNFKGVALLITSLLAMPLSMLFGQETNIVIMGLFATILGISSSEQLFSEGKDCRDLAQDKEEELIRWIYGIPEDDIDEFNTPKPMPEGYFDLKTMPEDVKESFDKCMD